MVTQNVAYKLSTKKELDTSYTSYMRTQSMESVGVGEQPLGQTSGDGRDQTEQNYRRQGPLTIQ